MLVKMGRWACIGGTICREILCISCLDHLLTRSSEENVLQEEDIPRTEWAAMYAHLPTTYWIGGTTL